jgi:NADH dehydrogenase
LLTGGTGFVGRRVLDHLLQAGYRVRLLLRPSRRSPALPPGRPMEVALASLNDGAGLRAAMAEAETVVHLASAERTGSAAALGGADVQGTRTLARAAADEGVRRVVFLSHLGAARTSAYPVMQAKATAEAALLRGEVPVTILRSAVVFGAGDRFTCPLARLMAYSPFAFPVPGDGSTLLQPLWVEDLAACIVWALDEPGTIGQTYEIGGPEFLTLREILTLVMEASRHRRALVSVRPPYLRAAASVLQRLSRDPAFTTFLIDYLAVSRTAELATIPRVFGLQPSRLEERLDYLRRPGRPRTQTRAGRVARLPGAYERGD